MTANIFEKINQASLKFLSPLTLDGTYKTTVNEAMSLVNAEYGSIVLETKNGLERIYASSSVLYKTKIRKDGYIHKSFSTHNSYIVNIEEIEDIYPEIKDRGIKCLIFIPLSYKRKAIGVLTLQSRKRSQFMQKQLDILNLFGSMASLAITKMNDQEKLKKAVEDRNMYMNLENTLEKVNKSGLRFLVALNLNEVVQTITEEAAKLVKADWAGLYLVDDKKLKEMAIYPSGERPMVPRRQGFTYRSYIERKTFVVQEDEIATSHPELIEKNYRSSICIPLSYQHKSIGALTLLLRGTRDFTNQELNLLKVFGSYASLAIRKSQLHEQLQESIEIRDNFIALSAHELRTPLTSIMGYIHLLYKRLATKDSTEGRWIQSLKREGERLNNLIAELLEINKIRSGQLQLNLKEFGFVFIIEKVLKEFQNLYPTRKIIFTNTVPPQKDIIIADEEKLSIVVSNILENAIKFSPEQSEVTLSLKKKDSFLLLEVTDKGEGINRDDVSKIFQGFYKVKGNVKEGIAVGLLFAKHIIAYHQGSINISSKISKGTTIQIKLPCVK